MTRALTLAQWRDAAIEAFPHTYHYKPRDLKRATALIRALFDDLQACGITDPSEITETRVLAWVWADIVRRDGSVGPPALATARFRQGIAQAAFKVIAKLGAAIDPMAATGDRIEWVGARPPRTLTEQEMQRVCAATRSKRRTSQKGALVALSRASGSAPALARARASDVDLDAATVRFTGPDARTCALDPWSHKTLAGYFKANAPAPDDLLCVDADTAPERAAHSVSSRIHRILRAAGLNAPDVTARSIRLTEAQRVLHTKGIAAAAQFLGSPSLDATAEALNYQWRHPSPAPDELEGPGDG